MCANAATSIISAYNVYQDEGQPLAVVHTFGWAVPAGGDAVELTARLGDGGLIQMRFDLAAGAAVMGTFTGDGASFYGSRFVCITDLVAALRT